MTAVGHPLLTFPPNFCLARRLAPLFFVLKTRSFPRQDPLLRKDHCLLHLRAGPVCDPSLFRPHSVFLYAPKRKLHSQILFAPNLLFSFLVGLPGSISALIHFAEGPFPLTLGLCSADLFPPRKRLPHSLHSFFKPSAVLP